MADLPTVPLAAPDTALVASLHHLSPAARKNLEEILELSHIGTSSPGGPLPHHFAYAHCLDSQRQKAADAAGHNGTIAIGSISDVFRLAIRARHAGWKRMLVIDALSDRQLKGRSRFCENPATEAILVDLSSGLPFTGSRNAPITLKRITIQLELNLLFTNEPIKLKHYPQPRHRFDDNLPEADHMELFSRGLVVHDPEGDIFGSHSMSPLRDNISVSTIPRLPEDMRELVLQHAACFDVDEKTTAPLRPSSKYNAIPVLAISPSSTTTCARFENDIRAACSDNHARGLKLYPWTGLQTATRAEVCALLDRHFTPGSTINPIMLVLFDEYIWRHQRQLVILQSSLSTPIVFAYCRSVDEALADLSKKRLWVPSIEQVLGQEQPVCEVLRPPTSPLFNDCFFDYHVRERMPHSPPPVFFTSSSSHDVDFHQLGLDWDLPNPVFTAAKIPYQPDEGDASIADLFRFITNMYKNRPYSPKPAPAHHMRTIICFDKHSLEDRTMALVKFHWRCDSEMQPQGRWDRFSCLGARVKRFPASEIAQIYDSLQTGFGEFSGLQSGVDEWFVPPDIYGEQARRHLEREMGPFLHMSGV